ncbi:zona pellucida sperm-binding protein 3d.2 isoform X2 [Antennarius striatus]|uniref:zona pellucida sperm-binding protein 3d.2 isoform X2 n=1 Tax=Antennarius striatus TaxID=241820 RepID=UPI0035B11400
MVNFSLFLSLLLTSSVDGRTRPTSEAHNRTTAVTLPPPFLQLPVFVDSRLPLVEREYFSPATGTGHETLPEQVRKVLLPVRPNTSPPGASGVSVKTSCNVKEMLVRVHKSVLDSSEMYSRVKLGTCRASNSTKDYLHFDYGLNRCGTKRKIINNQVVYRNVLHYAPPSLPGPIRRSAPFSLPIECYYNRFHYSYKIGYAPKTRMRKIFKQMRNTAKFILTPRNAQWERLSPSTQYVLGKPMYFEAEAPSVSQDERLYVHSCYVTPEPSHTSTPQFPVVTNFGCMLESKENHSRFIPHKPNTVRFSVDAFLFTGMTNQLYLHCTMSVDGTSPTPTAKSCNYDTNAGRWVELYGSDSVCECCDSKCSAAASMATKTISSRSWTVDSDVEPTSTYKRKTVSPTTARTEDTQMNKKATKRTTSQPRERLEEEPEWPFGGGGVALVEMETEEKRVKGLAVVEVEEDAAPRTTFEEIFEFDQ